MPASEWSTATRRRLGIDVIPTERKCGFCLWDRCDTKGNHATMCTGGASCILRHNEIRSILAKAIQDAGFKVGYAHGGGLHDDRKPGDIIAFNWKGPKHLLIDVSVTNPLAPTYRHHLVSGGPGNTAKHIERRKREKYWDLDKDKYIFQPFIVESTGALGPSAESLCTAIRKIRERKSCTNHARPNPQENNRTLVDPLQASISVTLQRHNAQMIIERQPPPSSLLAPGIAKCHEATTRLKRWAMSKICIKGLGPVSRMTWECPQPPPLPTSPPSPRWGKEPDVRQVNGMTDTAHGECPFSDAEIPPSPRDSHPKKITHTINETMPPTQVHRVCIKPTTSQSHMPNDNRVRPSYTHTEAHNTQNNTRPTC